jgi:hypothetical protein
MDEVMLKDARFQDPYFVKSKSYSIAARQDKTKVPIRSASFSTLHLVIPAMAAAMPMPSALTLELIARCSVSLLILFSAHKPHLIARLDHESPRCHPYPSSWTRPTPSVYARRDTSFPERLDTSTTRGNWLSIMSEQYIPSGLETGTGSAGCGWRGT